MFQILRMSKRFGVYIQMAKCQDLPDRVSHFRDLLSGGFASVRFWGKILG